MSSPSQVTDGLSQQSEESLTAVPLGAANQESPAQTKDFPNTTIDTDFNTSSAVDSLVHEKQSNAGKDVKSENKSTDSSKKNAAEIFTKKKPSPCPWQIHPPPRPFKKARYAWQIKNYEHTLSRMNKAIAHQQLQQPQHQQQLVHHGSSGTSHVSNTSYRGRIGRAASDGPEDADARGPCHAAHYPSMYNNLQEAAAAGYPANFYNPLLRWSKLAASSIDSPVNRMLHNIFFSGNEPTADIHPLLMLSLAEGNANVFSENVDSEEMPDHSASPEVFSPSAVLPAQSNVIQNSNHSSPGMQSPPTSEYDSSSDDTSIGDDLLPEPQMMSQSLPSSPYSQHQHALPYPNQQHQCQFNCRGACTQQYGEQQHQLSHSQMGRNSVYGAAAARHMHQQTVGGRPTEENDVSNNLLHFQNAMMNSSIGITNQHLFNFQLQNFCDRMHASGTLLPFASYHQPHEQQHHQQAFSQEPSYIREFLQGQKDNELEHNVHPSYRGNDLTYAGQGEFLNRIRAEMELRQHNALMLSEMEFSEVTPVASGETPVDSKETPVHSEAAVDSQATSVVHGSTVTVSEAAIVDPVSLPMESINSASNAEIENLESRKNVEIKNVEDQTGTLGDEIDVSNVSFGIKQADKTLIGNCINENKCLKSDLDVDIAQTEVDDQKFQATNGAVNDSSENTCNDVGYVLRSDKQENVPQSFGEIESRQASIDGVDSNPGNLSSRCLSCVNGCDNCSKDAAASPLYERAANSIAGSLNGNSVTVVTCNCVITNPSCVVVDGDDMNTHDLFNSSQLVARGDDWKDNSATSRKKRLREDEIGNKDITPSSGRVGKEKRNNSISCSCDVDGHDKLLDSEQLSVRDVKRPCRECCQKNTSPNSQAADLAQSTGDASINNNNNNIEGNICCSENNILIMVGDKPVNDANVLSSSVELHTEAITVDEELVSEARPRHDQEEEDGETRSDVTCGDGSGESPPPQLPAASVVTTHICDGNNDKFFLDQAFHLAIKQGLGYQKA